MWPVGTRLRLTQRARDAWHLFRDHGAKATVVRPGVFRGGMRVRVIVDGEKEQRNYCTEFWEKDE